MDVRFSGEADRGVRGDDPGSEVVDLMGVRKEWVAGGSRGGDGGGCSCVDSEVEDTLVLLGPFEDDAMGCSSVLSRVRLCCLVGRTKGKFSSRSLLLDAFRL